MLPRARTTRSPTTSTLSLLVVACALTAVPLSAQRARPGIPVVGVGFGVDTTAADVGDVVRLLRAYLARPGVRSDSAARAAGLWRDPAPGDGPAGDLTRGFAYQGFPATVLGVQAAAPGDSVYVVKVLYASSDTARRAVKPLALQRLYAVRAPGSPYGWQLSGAVARLTRDWERRAVGRIRFHYAPGQHPDTARAARAAAFVDSVATLFATRPPEWIDYYVTASPDEYQRAIGLDFFPLPSGRGTGTGGQALMNVVLAGDPALGEGYLHELVHVVLASTCCGNAVVGEGIATLLAGSKGRSAREMWGVLAAFQHAHPDVKLRALLDGDVGGAWGPAENDALYATDALIVEAIYRDAGVAGLRRLTRVPAGTDAILDALRRALPAEANDLDRWWRRAPAEYAASDDASALRPQRRTRARARARRGRARTG